MPMKIETEIENEMCVNSNQVFVCFFIHFYRESHFIAHSNLFNVKKQRRIIIARQTQNSFRLCVSLSLSPSLTVNDKTNWNDCNLIWIQLILGCAFLF